MKNIWFFSDPHYGHKNIVRGVSDWIKDKPQNINKLRDFDTLEEHNEALIQNINSLIKHDHIVYCLGDWAFGGHENVKKFRDRLECRNIHLILGNHDQHIEPTDSQYRELFSSVSHKVELDLSIKANISGKFGKQKFFLSHYSHQVWNKSHHGSIHLFGHSHGSLKGIGRSMDVGVDTHNLYPYHLDEILDIMKNVSWVQVDHHSQTTN